MMWLELQRALRRGPHAVVLLTAASLLAAAYLLVPGVARGQDAPAAGTGASTLDDSIEAGESEAEEPKRQLVSWNQYQGPWFTIRAGAGALYEFAGYGQDEESKEQIELHADSKFRDTRLLLKGRFPKFDREVTWTSGIMYDGPTDEWFVRETGVMVAVPELWGRIFVGRTKEGFSLNKVMNGYSGWTMERTMMNDVIPILADGVKWLGYLPKSRFLWNLGLYNDWFSEGQSFSTYDKQAVARLAWLPVVSEETHTLAHVGVSLRYGEPENGQLRLRSRPEANPAPYFVDTGTFPAERAKTVGLEGYYRVGPWLFGTEYFLHETSPKQGNDSLFHGGEVVVTWNITGETRAYNTRGGFFNAVSPAKTVFEGGPGAWEAVLRFSYIDLDDEGIQGGKFWRITPMVNWHLSDNARLELAYGYGMLDRFDLEGSTQFFQCRIQLWF